MGPYEFAILKADSKTEMLNWLNTNRYVVPAGTDGALAPYLRPGGYFLALKLKAGLSAGDIQPVVLRYRADLPVIPITLTQVAATPNLGVLIWVLGAGRAIPRSYFHTVINEAQIDWLGDAKSYLEVVQKAVSEAPGKHSFVTERAGDATLLQDVLDTPGRFDPYYLNTDRKANPARYADIEAKLQSFNAALVVQDLQDRIVTPTIEAGQLFREPLLPKLTRLYTVLAPEDMNLDPAFSFNPQLPDVSSFHYASLDAVCPDQGRETPEISLLVARRRLRRHRVQRAVGRRSARPAGCRPHRRPAAPSSSRVLSSARVPSP